MSSWCIFATQFCISSEQFSLEASRSAGCCSKWIAESLALMEVASCAGTHGNVEVDVEVSVGNIDIGGNSAKQG